MNQDWQQVWQNHRWWLGYVILFVLIAALYGFLRYVPYTFGEERRYINSAKFLGVAGIAMAMYVRSRPRHLHPNEEEMREHRPLHLKYGIRLHWLTWLCLGIWFFGSGITTTPIQGLTGAFSIHSSYYGPAQRRGQACRLIGDSAICGVNGQRRDGDWLSFLDRDEGAVRRQSCVVVQTQDLPADDQLLTFLGDQINALEVGCAYMFECTVRGDQVETVQAISLLNLSRSERQRARVPADHSCSDPFVN